ncbi:MAG TPA: hypothetical protein VI731_06845 [Bacteroidia bacterium]|nr:hypothetical protein [Bacteroidia bacterium]
MKKTWKIASLCILALGLVAFVGFRGRPKSSFNFYEFWRHANEAEYLFDYKKDYAAALKEFKWMEKNGNEYFPGLNEFLEEAICYAKLGDTAMATNCLRKAVLRGYVNIDEDAQWAKKEIGNKSYVLIKQELPELRRHYYASSTLNIYARLEEQKHGAIDQFVRSNRVLKMLKKEDANALMHYADSLNITEFITSLKKGDVPPTSWLLYHLYDEHDKYFPFLDSCLLRHIFAGKSAPGAYAFWYDRQCVYVQNRPQKYGEYISNGIFDLNAKTPSRPTIEGKLNVDSVDFYRAQIGLPPLWQDALRINFELPAGYKYVSKE